MANRQITQAVYNKLVEAYREQPEVHKHAAQASGLNWRTARRGWERGWTPRIPWAPAIKEVIGAEQKDARARLIAEKQQQVKAEVEASTTTPVALQSAAREDATNTLVQEAKLVRAARENTLALMATTQQVMAGVIKMVPRAREVISTADLEPLQIVRFFQRLSSLMRDANECALRTLQLERLKAGEPMAIIGVTDVSMEEAERETRRTLALIEEAKKLGVIPSGEGTNDGKPSGSNGSEPIVH